MSACADERHTDTVSSLPPMRIPTGSPLRAGALLALLYLPPSILLVFPAVWLTNRALPGLEAVAGRWVFFGEMAAVCALGGLLWARRMGGGGARRRAWPAALAFGASTAAAAFLLTEAETWMLNRALDGREVPAAPAFGVLFSGAVLLVVGATALALALGAGRPRAAATALACGGAAMLAFAAVAAAFHLAGWRVGAPGAEARFTMLVVTGAGLFAATVAGGAAVGRAFASRPPG